MGRRQSGGLAMINVERFMSKLVPDGSCLVFIGHREANGYGRFSVDRHMRWAHRVAWEIVNGAPPPGMYVCHHCDNPPCCRVDHLFLGTPGDNIRDMRRKGRARGKQIASGNGLKTACPVGHPYDEQNTQRRPNGTRYCRACENARRRAKYAHAIEAGAAKGAAKERP